MLRRFRHFPSKVRLPDRTRKRSALLAALLLGSLASGGCCLPQMVEATCSPYEAIKNTSMLKFRAARQARQVWKECHEQRYVNHSCANDVRKGFVNAYVEAAMGMRGCPPPVPNRGTLSLDCVMHRYPAAIPWYEGYNIGFASAVAQGVDKWRFAPANPDLRVTQCGCPSDGGLGHDGLMGQEMIGHDGALLPQGSELIPQDAELLPHDAIQQMPVEIDQPLLEVPEAETPAELVPEPVADVLGSSAEPPAPGVEPSLPSLEPSVPEAEIPAPNEKGPLAALEVPELQEDVPGSIESASDADVSTDSVGASQEGLAMPASTVPEAVVPEAVVPEAVVPEAVVPEAVVPEAEELEAEELEAAVDTGFQEGPEMVSTTDLPVQLPYGMPAQVPSASLAPNLPQAIHTEVLDSVHVLPTSWTLGRRSGD